ncbi:hypothetical protein CCMA1212_001163 [Trichoderma ghanense]|uniref:Uncharacterized protein n=1 Tax=Trichoderma ghanense TaxID=65468 RepID=A0ABY2HFI7_9HYPO
MGKRTNESELDDIWTPDACLMSTTLHMPGELKRKIAAGYATDKHYKAIIQVLDKNAECMAKLTEQAREAKEKNVNNPNWRERPIRTPFVRQDALIYR